MDDARYASEIRGLQRNKRVQVRLLRNRREDEVEALFIAESGSSAPTTTSTALRFSMQIAAGRNAVGGSIIGSIAETQEVLDFCAEHAIGPDIQVIPIGEINDAYDKVEAGEVRFRYVIDMATLKQDG